MNEISKDIRWLCPKCGREYFISDDEFDILEKQDCCKICHRKDKSKSEVKPKNKQRGRPKSFEIINKPIDNKNNENKEKNYMPTPTIQEKKKDVKDNWKEITLKLSFYYFDIMDRMIKVGMYDNRAEIIREALRLLFDKIKTE